MSSELPTSLRFLTQKQLAELLNISERTLERWRWLGQGCRYIKIGGRVVYRVEDVEAFETVAAEDATGRPES